MSSLIFTLPGPTRAQICWRLLAFLPIAMLLLAVDLHAFRPKNWLNPGNLLPGSDSESHESITKAAILGPNAPFYLQDLGVSEADQSTRDVVNLLVQIGHNQDAVEILYQAADHFDSEEFEAGRAKLKEHFEWIDWFMTKSADPARAEDDLKVSRVLLAKAFHSIQDFYAHSSWVYPLGKTNPCLALLPPWPDWGVPLGGNALGRGVLPSCTVCADCTVLESIPTPGILTSGYFRSPPASPLKCRHGDPFSPLLIKDDLEELLRGEGMNKDTTSAPGCRGNPQVHYSAARLARESTIEFLRSLEKQFEYSNPGKGRELMRRLLGIRTVVRFFGDGGRRAVPTLVTPKAGRVITLTNGVNQVVYQNIVLPDGEQLDSPLPKSSTGVFETLGIGSAGPGEARLSTRFYRWDPSDPYGSNTIAIAASGPFSVSGPTLDQRDAYEFEIPEVSQTESYVLEVEGLTASSSVGAVANDGSLVTTQYKFQVPEGVTVDPLDGGCYDSGTRMARGAFGVARLLRRTFSHYHITIGCDDLRCLEATGSPFLKGWYVSTGLEFQPVEEQPCASGGTKQRWKVTIQPENRLHPQAVHSLATEVTQAPWIQNAEFYRFESGASHPDYFRISGGPIAGETNILRVSVGGEHLAARIETTNTSGIRRALLTVTNVQNDISEYRGLIFVPMEPFRLRVRTIDTNGNQTTLLSGEIFPTGLGITSHDNRAIEAGTPFALTVHLLNRGIATKYDLSAWTDSAEIEITSVDPPDVTLAKGEQSQALIRGRSRNAQSNNGSAGITFAGVNAEGLGNSLRLDIPIRFPSILNETLIGLSDGGAISFSTNVGSLNVIAKGAGIIGTNDSFHFNSQSLSGDFDAKVQVANLASLASNTRAALVLRDALYPGSPVIAVSIGYSKGQTYYNAVMREAPLSSSSNWPIAVISSSIGTNTWLRLARRGAVFTAYGGSDGQSWTTVATMERQVSCFGVFGVGSWSGSDSDDSLAVSYKNLEILNRFPPQIVDGPSDANASIGSALALGVAVCDDDYVTFQWYRNGVQVSGEDQSILKISRLTTEDSGNYWAVVSDNSGSSTSRVAMVSLAMRQPPRFREPQVLAGQFEVKLEGDINISYIIEASANLQDWVFVGTAVLTNVSLFRHPLPEHSKNLFFRARAP